MDKIVLEAKIRDGRGKGPARRVRAAGMIPAVCYGREIEPIALSVDPRTLDRMLRGPYGKNVQFQLVAADESGEATTHEVMLKTFQKNPISREIEHADFFVYDPEKRIIVDVPVVLTGRPIGVRQGGRLQQVRRSVKVKARPASIPQAIELDVSHLRVKERSVASELTMPDDVELMFDHDFAIAQVNLPRGKTAVAEDAEA